MNEEPIRISREEALDTHVDDLLRRQMSLRGQTGVARDKRRWYLSNWFIFAVVGLVGALVAWGIIEPFFEDYPYVQGEIAKLKISSDDSGAVHPGVVGYLEIRDDRILVSPLTTAILPDGRHRPLREGDLTSNQVIGVYTHIKVVEDEPVIFALSIKLKPGKAAKTAETKTVMELHSRASAAGMLLFPVVAGLVGLFIGCVDGIVCRLPRRALLSGFVGLLIGLIGGFLSGIFANIVYSPLTRLAMTQMHNGHLGTAGFMLQMCGRSIAWSVAGMAMGLGQGIALRSWRLLLYGFIGGAVGGLLGGVLFDPIDFFLLAGRNSALWSRCIGLGVVGASVGALIGVVELLSRDAWLRMTEGPLAGKEFLLFKDLMQIGASPRSDIYLFNDPTVADQHATLRSVGDECDLEAASKTHLLLVNGRPTQHTRLRNGDQITIGRTMFTFQKRGG